VVFQVDLHAADVDVGDAARLERLDLGYGGRPVRQESPLALGHDRPGPGKNCPLPGAPAAGFDPGDGRQQVGRQGLALFRPRRLGPAELPGIGRFGAGRQARQAQAEGENDGADGPARTGKEGKERAHG
jgi:hypothetical protein